MNKLITLQDILDAARQHFIVENQPPAWIKEIGCTYKAGVNGNTCGCAFGAVLPKDHESRLYPGPANELVRVYQELFAPSVCLFQPPRSGYTLSRLQGMLHDDMVDNTTGKWRRSVEARDKLYANVAAVYGLTYKRVYNEE